MYFFFAEHMEFFNCLGDLDSCVSRDFVGQDYDILQAVTPTPPVLKNPAFNLVGDSEVNAISPDPERFVLLDPIQGAHEVSSQGTKHSMLTPVQISRAKFMRSERDQKKKNKNWRSARLKMMQSGYWKRQITTDQGLTSN